MTKAKTPSKKRKTRKPTTPPTAKQAHAGQWKPGQSGNPDGRAKGFDFRFAIQEYCDKHKVDLRDAMGRVFLAMIDEAEKGDVQAAKLVIDRLCGPQRQELEVAVAAVINITQETRDGLREMLSDDRNVAGLLADLRRRTN